MMDNIEKAYKGLETAFLCCSTMLLFLIESNFLL